MNQAASNRAPLDESGTKVGWCHTVHALKCQQGITIKLMVFNWHPTKVFNDQCNMVELS